jgi:hypothetical protein
MAEFDEGAGPFAADKKSGVLAGFIGRSNGLNGPNELVVLSGRAPGPRIETIRQTLRDRLSQYSHAELQVSIERSANYIEHWLTQKRPEVRALIKIPGSPKAIQLRQFPQGSITVESKVPLSAEMKGRITQLLQDDGVPPLPVKFAGG